MSDRCPKCGSPRPHLHPAVQCEGEVHVCSDPFHQRQTPQNTPHLQRRDGEKPAA